MPNSTARIQPAAFKISIGVLLALAVIFAAARTFIRIKKFRRIHADDCFVFLSVVCLIAGTGILYVNVPYIYLQLNVEAGVEAPPADLIQQLLYDEKLQNAATILILLALFSVKWAFLFFFRYLIGQTNVLITWWWTVFAILVPGTIFGVFTNIFACPFTGPSVLEKCATPGAVNWLQAILYASIGVDVGTDLLIISIPVALLWRVQISIRRKLSLAAVLCLSFLMIIISIITVAKSKDSNGQSDAAWLNFWTSVETSIAVMTISVGAFRSLFSSTKSTNENRERSRIWPRIHHIGGRGRHPNLRLNTMPSATLTGMRTIIREGCPTNRNEVQSEATTFHDTSPLTDEPGIRVTGDISTIHSTENNRPSYECLV